MFERIVISLSLLALLSGCDLLDGGAKELAAKAEADGKAVGSACRHGLRSIEDCYASYPKMSKAAIFEGWREMDQYMRENNVQGQASTGAAAPPAAAASKPEAAEEPKETAEPKAAGKPKPPAKS